MQNLSFSYSHLKNLLLTQFPSEKNLVSVLQKVHTHLRGRSFSLYAEDPEMISAYTLFYLPTNYPKFQYLLKSLPTAERELFLRTPFVELGSGPGTFLLAFLSHVEASAKATVTGVEISELMRDQASKILTHFFPNGSWKLTDKLIDGPSDPLNQEFTLFLGHSLCEIGAHELLLLVDRWNPTRVAWIEPGDSTTFNEVVLARKGLIERGYSVLFPCPSNGPCPVACHESEWCHQVMVGEFDPEYIRLSQLVSIDRRYLPMMSHYYTKKPTPSADENVVSEVMGARVFRFLGENKAAIRLQLCLDISALSPQLIEVEILKREAKNREELKRFQAILTGDFFHFKIVKKLSEEKWRIVPQLH